MIADIYGGPKCHNCGALLFCDPAHCHECGWYPPNGTRRRHRLDLALGVAVVVAVALAIAVVVGLWFFGLIL